MCVMRHAMPIAGSWPMANVALHRKAPATPMNHHRVRGCHRPRQAGCGRPEAIMTMTNRDRVTVTLRARLESKDAGVRAALATPSPAHTHGAPLSQAAPFGT
jgi:hypothetical protein